MPTRRRRRRAAGFSCRVSDSCCSPTPKCWCSSARSFRSSWTWRRIISRRWRCSASPSWSRVRSPIRSTRCLRGARGCSSRPADAAAVAHLRRLHDRRRHLAGADAGKVESEVSRVPDAVRHSSCRSAEPGPSQAPDLVTAPALHTTSSRCAASGARYHRCGSYACDPRGLISVASTSRKIRASRSAHCLSPA